MSGGWRDAVAEPPADRRLVLVVLADGTKEVLSWSGNWPWADQHAVSRPDLAPYVWHDLPPPPPPPPIPLVFVPARDVETVHILRHGFPMCRFTTELPGGWPKGHRWVSFADLEELPEADCPECRSAFGFPECPSCGTDLAGTRRSRVDQESGRGIDLPCVDCGSPTSWRTQGVRSSFWAEFWRSS